jgi:hypothetical protein
VIGLRPGDRAQCRPAAELARVTRSWPSSARWRMICHPRPARRPRSRALRGEQHRHDPVAGRRAIQMMRRSARRQRVDRGEPRASCRRSGRPCSSCRCSRTVGNAIRFRSPRRHRIGARADGGELLFAVDDNGPASPDVLPRVRPLLAASRAKAPAPAWGSTSSRDRRGARRQGLGRERGRQQHAHFTVPSRRPGLAPTRSVDRAPAPRTPARRSSWCSGWHVVRTGCPHGLLAPVAVPGPRSSGDVGLQWTLPCE